MEKRELELLRECYNVLTDSTGLDPAIGVEKESSLARRVRECIEANKPKAITERDNMEKEWYEEAHEQTTKTLPDFINHVMNDYQHDYGTVCKAIAACAIATAWAANREPQGGITGFQAGAVMWEFVRAWSFSSNRTSLRIIDYDNMLYPQYEHKFEKTIPESTFKLIQKAAKESLEKDELHPKVRAHMESIVNGVVPFGYTISED